jgi:trehalose 6-phosphate phosphatase
MPTAAGTLTRTLTAPPIPTASETALFLDLDGTLAPLASTPDAVLADPRRTGVLLALDRALAGRLAIVSGRTLGEIDRISGGAAQAASGVHGLERRRRDGSLDGVEASRHVADAVAAFQAFAADWPGVIVEDKAVSAGLHYRRAPTAENAARALAQRISDDTGLDLQPGHMVLELKTPGTDKGQAVTAFMAEVPFMGAAPIMVGDDLTDEAGFRAAAALGGYGVLVGPERETAARHRLGGVEAVLTWLEAIAEAHV